MRYTPVELRHVNLRRSLFGGYKRTETEVLLSEVADSFEDVWRERGELADKLDDLEKHLDEIKRRETLLASTLVAAERTAAEAVEAAKREAEIIVAEAHQESRSITRAAQNERERLFAESRRVEMLLRAALGIVEESRTGTPGGGDDDGATSWPGRENTREFEAVSTETQAEPKAPEPPPAVLPPVREPLESDDDIPWSGRDFAWG